LRKSQEETNSTDYDVIREQIFKNVNLGYYSLIRRVFVCLKLLKPHT
jgi:hypothetical protein